MRNKVTLLNMLTSLILQICMIVSGFIIPKIILVYFGSVTNGLVASLNQFLSYISLLEGGVTGVIAANLYKPLVSHDSSKLSAVIVTAQKFYRNIGIIFIGYSLCVSVIYPLAFGLDFWLVFLLTLIIALNLLIQYMFTLTLRTLLTADKKLYIVSSVQIIITVLNTVLAYVSVNVYPSIHLMKFISGVLFLIQPVAYSYFVKKYYKIDWRQKPDNDLLKERWNGFAVNFAAFIHTSTDITILTVFTDLAIVSVYSIYSLVTIGLMSLIQALTNGINATIGQAYARSDWDDLNQKMDLYEYIICVLVGFLFTVGALLITPFVMIYTSGIHDANYDQPEFGLLLLFAEALYIVKYPHLNLAYAANKFKEITRPAFIEAFINIVVSIMLVGKWGLIGVALGTISGMTYRLIFHVNYTSKIIVSRSKYIFYKKFLLFLFISIMGFCLCKSAFPLLDYNIIGWLAHAVFYSVLLGCLYLGISLLFFRKELNFFTRYLKR